MTTTSSVWELNQSRLLHIYFAVPRPRRVAQDVECVVPIWCTQYDRVCFTHATPCLCRVPAVLRPCRLESDFSGHDTAQQWHGIACVNICSLSAACGRPAQIRLLPTITRTFTKAVNQNATVFWDVLICSDDDDDDNRLYRIIHFYELTLKLKTVFLLLLWYVFIVCSSFDCLWATTISKFQSSN